MSLGLFWNLREDTIWIMPLCVVASLATIISIVIKVSKEKNKKIFFKSSTTVLLPWIVFLVINLCICTINYNYYGVFTTNDRTRGNFAELMSLMIQINYEDDEDVDTEKCVISKDKMEYIVDNSESLSEIKETIMKWYAAWAGGEDKDLNSDLFVWAIREALADLGYYETGSDVDDFCKKVITELEAKIDDGTLTLDEGIMLSSSTRMMKLSDIPNLLKQTLQMAKILATYETAETKFSESNGTNEEIREIERLTNSLLLYKGESEETQKYNKVQEKSVDIANNIISVYQKISIPLCIISLILYVAITILQIPNIKTKNGEFFNQWLIITGIFLSCVILVMAVAFFIGRMG